MRRRHAHELRARGLTDDPQWYRDAIIYELRVRSFFDSNDDGVGDFVGLEAKLDYLADLGVTALWLLPFYPSPLRDDGYDIADYREVHAELGTLDDFRRFLDAAHARGLRVITELVLNHTSDQHPWFQRARRAEKGSPERGFYVWSPTAEPYAEARIIFRDFETSNWTWDPMADEYFWHRFYSHQPDLNFDNPAVQEALLGVVDFWLEMGVDGLRLDAVPYLYEADGTSCENLPNTHAFLRRLRAHVDGRFKNRMLLAEANQWPEDAAAYFGAGDECHMNFHFPLMPRMFMAIHMEDSFPIVDILAQTPTPPSTCQWALFLRNHDELTLEMVTDDERDYMYRAYANDAAARINLGIRRRLAPLVENDRRKVELLNGLLFSLSGTPVLYYGDEIGMGDNIFLGDRDGVRTPMQWSMDRNAGFSRANTQRLILPVNTDSEFHYESLNVEAQANNPSSLLWWTKRLIAVRREYKAFGSGTLEVLPASNPKVFAFLRRLDDEIILVAANLSRAVQHVELDLSRYKGLRPVEVFGGAALPPISDSPLSLTLSGHGFYWLSLERALKDTVGVADSAASMGRISGLLGSMTSNRDTRDLEDALSAYLVDQSWFSRSDRELRDLHVVDVLTPDALDDNLRCVLVRAEFDEGEPEHYPLWFSMGPTGLSDAWSDPASAKALMRSFSGGGGGLSGRLGSVLASASLDPIIWDDTTVPRAVQGAHANVVLQVGERFVLKVFRRTDDGPSLDVEICRALQAGGQPCQVPLVSVLEYKRSRAEPMTLALLETFVPNAGTAWHQALAEVGRYYERVLTTHPNEAPPVALSLAAIVGGVADGPPPAVRDLLGTFFDTLVTLGREAAAMHRSLMTLTAAAFAPEAYTPLARRSEYQALRNLAGVALRELAERQSRLGQDTSADAAFVLARRGDLLGRFDPVLADRTPALRIRTHGDFHLEQVLFTGKAFAILDFEGERDRSFNDRRRKRSPLRDVACMLRSIDNAALVALWAPGTVRDVDRVALSPWAALWSSWMCSQFYAGYAEGARDSTLLPENRSGTIGFLGAFSLERALRDLREELSWANPGTIIPLRALAAMLGASPTGGEGRV